MVNSRRGVNKRQRTGVEQGGNQKSSSSASTHTGVRDPGGAHQPKSRKTKKHEKRLTNRGARTISYPLSFHPSAFLLSPPTLPITSLTVIQSAVLVTTSLISSAISTNSVSLDFPLVLSKLNDRMLKFPVPFPTGVTMRFRTMTDVTSISGRGGEP